MRLIFRIGSAAILLFLASNNQSLAQKKASYPPHILGIGIKANIFGPESAYSFGISAETRIYKNFGVETGFLYGSAHIGTFSSTGGIEEPYSPDYKLIVPIMLKAYWYVNFSAGVSFAFAPQQMSRYNDVFLLTRISKDIRIGGHLAFEPGVFFGWALVGKGGGWQGGETTGGLELKLKYRFLK